MSTLPENELDLDKLFLPAWAQEPPSAKNYAQFAGADTRPERGDEQCVAGEWRYLDCDQ